MDDSDDIDRTAILARRRRFILAALGGLAGTGACARVEPPPTQPAWDFELAGEPARTKPSEPLPPEPPKPLPMSIEELRANLQDPSWDLCVETRVVSDPLDEELREQLAEAHHVRGSKAMEEGNFDCAVLRFEEAYYLTPGRHEQAVLVGEAAVAAGDYDKAVVYLKHYLKYSDVSKHPEVEQRAIELLELPELREAEQMRFRDSEPRVCLSIIGPEPEPELVAEEPKRRRSQLREERARRIRPTR
jgi:tetratricopeptide (TPR) repeat protein